MIDTLGATTGTAILPCAKSVAAGTHVTVAPATRHTAELRAPPEIIENRVGRRRASLCSRPPQTAECSLQAAFTALVKGEDLADHLPLFRQHYGSISTLVPYLQETLAAHPQLLTSEHEWLTVIRFHPSLLRLLPPSFTNETFCIRAVVQAGSFVALPTSLSESQREAICTKACLVRSELLKILPEQWKSAELCETVCARRPAMLRYVPGRLRTPELCARACAQHPTLFACLSALQRKYDGLAQAVCRQNGDMLHYVAVDDRSLLLCRYACLSCGQALRHVPEDLLEAYPKLCAIACQDDGMALQYVPAGLLKRFPKLYRAACHSNGMALQYVPRKLRSQEICEAAVAASADALQLVPEGPIREALYTLACTYNGAALRHCHPLKRRRKLCLTAFHAETDGHLALEYIPEKWRTQAMYEVACREDYSWLARIPDHIDRQPLDLMAVERYGSLALQYIPPQHHSAVLCRKAVHCNSTYIECVAKPYLTLELFLVAVSRAGWNDNLHSAARAALSASDYRLFVTLCATRNRLTQVKVLTCPALPDDLKQSLVDFLCTASGPLTSQSWPDSSALYRSETPLTSSIPNTSAYRLLAACYQNPGYQPPLRQAGVQLQRYIASELQGFDSCQRLAVDQQPCLRQTALPCTAVKRL